MVQELSEFQHVIFDIFIIIISLRFSILRRKTVVVAFIFPANLLFAESPRYIE